MSLTLVCIAGEHKGVIWPITGAPLVIGRHPDCAIMLNGPTVSRQHCQVFLDAETAHIQDLGSRNQALVNGRPVKGQALAQGDEILLGRDHFVVACCADLSPVGEMAPTPLPGTLDWERIASVAEGQDVRRVRPRTVQDLAMLYEAVCEFSDQSDPDLLLQAARRRLRHYFNPEAVWVSRGRGHAGQYHFVSDPTAEEGAPNVPAPEALMDACVREKRAQMDRSGADPVKDAERLLYAAPVCFDGMLLAVLAVQTWTSRDVHPEGGLQFITLFAASLGPALFGADRRAALRQDNERLRVRMGESQRIIGDSAVLTQLRHQIARAAASDISVLITGETGVGKELVARSLHAQSHRADGALVIVNCAAIPRELFESELFGHTKGAFTGATSASPGLLLQADRGTLFLDEIGDLSPDNQARILRVVENGVFRPVGASRDTRVDIRIIAATNHDLTAAIDAGRFREDLFHRLNGVHIHVPPLREHPEDIATLSDYFLSMLQDAPSNAKRIFAPGAIDALQMRAYPGNVRELRQTVHRALAFSQGETIEAEDIQVPSETASVADATHSPDAPRLSLRELEKQYIIDMLRHYDDNVRLAAQALGISRTTLYTKIDEYREQSSSRQTETS